MQRIVPKLIHLRFDELLFVSVLGIATTFLGYQFGMGNQTEHMPLVLRLLDPDYLKNDFFVESAIGFGPRFYYVHILAFLAKWMTLPLAVLFISLSVNIALAALSFLAVRDLLQGDRLAGYIAAILVVSVSSFPLGLVTDIRFIDLQPASLAIPGCLAAVWAGLRGNAIFAACLAGISCLPHPLYGVETGAIAIATALLVGLVATDTPLDKSRIRFVFFRTFAATVILGGAAFVFWALPQSGQSSDDIATAELISILAYFRAPHHYIPSQFPIEHYIAFACFVVASTLCWSRWRRSHSGDVSALKFLAPPAIVFLACLAGYLLTEVWPSRVGVISQPFRMLYIVKWLGFLLLAWQFSAWLRGSGPRAALASIALLGSGAAHAIIAFLAILAERIDRRVRRIFTALPPFLAPAALLAATLLLLLKAGKLEETLMVAIAMGMALPLLARNGQPVMRLVPVALALLVVTATLSNRANRIIEWRFLDPVISFSDHRGDDADAARWALQNTPETAIFVIPPNMGTFRLLARRAVVVDFEALPFDGIAMREWRSRIRECYGKSATGGFEALAELAENYRRTDDNHLDRIALMYDPDYAVLNSQTATSRPIIYRNANFKIVALSDPHRPEHYSTIQPPRHRN